MDRRGLRAVVVLAAVAVIGSVLLAAREPGRRPTSATGPGSPDSSMAGPVPSAAIGPTAIPGSSGWDEVVDTSSLR